MEKLLVCTYDGDKDQFEIFCQCLTKNWKGNQFLTVVVNSSKDWPATNHHAKQTASKCLPNWTVEFIDGRHPSGNGVNEMLINKVRYSIDDRFEETIVFDAKDYLLRPADLSVFKQGNNYRTVFILDQPHQEMYPDSVKLFDFDISDIPAMINLTPWVWNTYQLKKYWQYMNIRFGPWEKWHQYPGGMDADTYYLYTVCDTRKSFEFFDKDHNPIIVSGGWTHQTYKGMLQEAEDFETWQERIVWKHSRKLEDPRCAEVTNQMLRKYSIV